MEFQLKSLSLDSLQEIQQKFLSNRQQSNTVTDCYQLHSNIDDQPFEDTPSPPEEVNLVAMLSEVKKSQDNDWIVDSSASSHFLKNKNFSKFSFSSSISRVTTTGGSKLPVTGIGCINFQKNKKISNVFYVPSIQSNLLSIGHLKDLGYDVLFKYKHYYVLHDSDPQPPDPDQVLLQGDCHLVNRLYTMNQRTSTTTSRFLSSACSTQLANSTHAQPCTATLW